VGFLPGGAISGIENAYLSYTGLKPFGGRMAIEGGIMDVPYTLDEATSSNDTVFMERASSGIIAQNVAAGDFRSAAGARWFTDTVWVGGYVTGPVTGAIHSASSITPNGTTEQVGAVARAAGQIVSGNDYSVHIGADAQWLIRAPHNQITGARTLTLSDRPELRIDPTTLISTGALAGVSGAEVYSVQAAATYGPLYLQASISGSTSIVRTTPCPCRASSSTVAMSRRPGCSRGKAEVRPLRRTAESRRRIHSPWMAAAGVPARLVVASA
jgi:phosphate-selective porin OprO/OprP